MTARTGKHTPGKWATIIPNGRTVVSEGRLICDMSDRATLEEEEANARLIAAAPELLEALQAYRAKFGRCGQVAEQADAAIAKALGNE